jgi:hypothetical protein
LTSRFEELEGFAGEGLGRGRGSRSPKKRWKIRKRRVIQVKRPITKLYIWAQGSFREEERVLPYPVFAPIFCVKISAS